MKLSTINIEERMKFHAIQGLSLTYITNGQISMNEHYGLLESGTANLVDSDSVFNACSISKFVTGMVVMVLVERGLLGLDEDVNNCLLSWRVPESKLTLHNKVTLRRLLTHQSGIVDPENSFIEHNLKDQIPSMVELLEGKTVYCKIPIEVTIEPGSEFHYSDAGFCIIQQIIEDITDKPFEVTVDDFIFKPLNMEYSTFPNNLSEETQINFSCGHNRNGDIINGKYSFYPYPAASGLWTTSVDIAKLVIELIHSVNGQSKIGLSKLSAKEIILPQGKEWTGLGVFLDGAEEELEISSLGWGVGFQSMMVASPLLETGLVIVTNTDLGVHQLKGMIGEIYYSSSF
jgi:CubicO group peptidase (beta-lactamase class C family)